MRHRTRKTTYLYLAWLYSKHHTLLNKNVEKLKKYKRNSNIFGVDRIQSLTSAQSMQSARSLTMTGTSVTAPTTMTQQLSDLVSLNGSTELTESNQQVYQYINFMVIFPIKC